MENKTDVTLADISPLIPLQNLLSSVLEKVEEMSRHEKSCWGIPTGLSYLDRKIFGLNKSDLIVLASRPGMGKTSMALNIALNTARSNGKTVVIFSLVTSKEELSTHLLSMEALTDSDCLRTGELAEKDWEKIASAMISFAHMDILIDDNPMLTVEDMSVKCKNIENLELVVIDDLQFITSADGNKNPNESRYETVSAILRRLKIMAKELNVPLLCLSQVNRANEKREDKRPQLSDLRDSGVIEEYADIVMFLYRDDYYNEDSEKHNIAECIVAKNRHGITGTVPLYWMPQYTMFATIESPPPTQQNEPESIE